MRNLYIIITCLLSAFLLKAQEFDAVKNLTPAAPEAAQFQKYGDVPVSYYTGTPNISIPLYTIQDYDISVPVGLTYHASGVKLTEMSSWVGTGWSLSAGGVLSRSVRGRPDFVNHMDEIGVDTYFGGPNIPTTLGISDYDYVVSLANQNADAQPDEYYINFLGRSVKFYVNQSKEIIVDPSSKVKIDRPTVTNPFWVVTDASGMRYTFGSTTDAREVTKHRRPGGVEMPYISSWYLTKIESATGHLVTFDYQLASDFTHIPNQRHHGSFQLVTGVVPGCGEIPGLNDGNILRGSTGQPIDFKPTRLTQINYQRGGEDYTVEFVASSGREDAFDITDQSYQEYYKLYFLHVKRGIDKRLSYVFNFDDRSNGLWLMSLNRVSYAHNEFSGGNEETHYFDYHNHTGLPANKSYDMDYWGLYNGAGNTASSNLIPYSPSYTIGADRDYNETFAKYGMLTKITYPTGGYNQFDYEPHTIASAAPGGELIAGGLRIKKITTSTQGGPGSAPDIVREFVYKAPGASNSSGNPSAPFGNNTLTTLYYSCDGFEGQPDSFFQLDSLKVYSSHSVNGGGFMSIGYSAVQELIGPSGINGRNVYEFTHVSSPFYEAGFEPQGFEQIFSPVYFNSMANGRMTRQLTQKKVGDDFETMREVVNTFETVVNASDYIAGLATSMSVDGNSASTLGDALAQIKPTGNFLDVVAYLPYRIKPDWVRLTRTVEKTFEGGAAPITKTTDYTKANYAERWYHDFTTRTRVTYGVSGDIETTSVIYPFQQSSVANDDLRDKYIINPINTTTVRGTLPINQSTVMGGSKTTYAMQSLTVDGTSISLAMPHEQYQITQGAYGTNGGGQEVLAGKFVQYNAEGLPTEIEDAIGHKTGLFWYNDLLLATCANASVSDFFYEGFEYESSGIAGDAHTGNYFNSGDYTLSFPVSSTRKYKLSYWYRSGGKWYYQEEAYAGESITLSLGDAIDDVRVFPEDALMTTYTHDSFYGLTSQAGPNNRPMYYIYDAAGRLKLLKDQDGKILQAYEHKFLASITD